MSQNNACYFQLPSKSDKMKMCEKQPTDAEISKPYRILYIQPYNLKSGPHHCLRELIANLDRRLFTPVIVLPRHSDVAEEFLDLGAKVLYDSEIRTIPRSFSPFSQLMFWLRMACSIKRIAAIIREEKISLVHINSEACWVGGFAAKIAKVPVISHLHGLSVLSPLWVGRLTSMFLNKFNKKLIAVSNIVKNAYLSKGVYPWRIETIYNGLDITSFNPQSIQRTLRKELDIKENTPLIGMVANFDPRKGHHDFIAACALVFKRLPCAMFVIVGETNMANCPGYFKQIKKMVQRFGMTESVRYLGSRDDIPNVLASLDVVVQPSLTEAGPIVPIEAMAMECPIVVTDVGGNSEEVIDGQTGLVVPAGNVQAIFEAIVEQLSNRTRAKSFGKQGRNRVLSMFTSSVNAEKIQHVYHEILTNNTMTIQM